MAVSCAAYAGVARAGVTPSRQEAQRAIAALPAWFEPNAGRLPGDVKFLSRGGAGTLYVNAAGADFHADRGSLRLRMPGANPNAAVEGVSPTGAYTLYVVGADRAGWRNGIAHYAKVRTRQLYPGIDVLYYLSDRELEFDFVVAPGADPGSIRLAFDAKPQPDAHGDLVFANGFRQRRPIAFQQTEAGRKPVEASYQVAANGEVRLALGNYDHSVPLVIDPVLDAGFLGGDAGDIATAIAVDRQGSVYVTGSSASTITLPPGTSAIQDKPKGGRDVFLAKLTPDGSGKLALAYWTQLGGSNTDEANAIVVDDAGFVYLAGYTDSTDFPLAGGPLQTAFGGEMDAFVAKILPSAGSDGLWYSQTYGGEKVDVANAMALDGAGGVYIAGYTTSDAIPGASSSTFQCCNRGGYEGFIARVAPDSSNALAYATYFGGNSTDAVTGIAVNAAGEAVVVGYTAADNFAVTGDDVYQSTMRSSMDAFVALFDFNKPGLDALLYATYLGGDGLDVPTAVLLEGNSAWITGYTFSSDFPVTPGAYRTSPAGSADAFLLRFDFNNRYSQAAIAYGTYLGGSETEVPYGMALLPQGRVALAGYTYSENYPLAADTARGPRSGAEAFLSVIDTTKSQAEALTYSTVLCGSTVDAGTGVAADAAGNLFMSGYTYSSEFPVTYGGQKLSPGGLPQGFVVKLTPDASSFAEHLEWGERAVHSGANSRSR